MHGSHFANIGVDKLGGTTHGEAMTLECMSI